MKISKSGYAAFLIIICITSCKKESIIDSPPVTNYLSVKMNPIFLTALQVDSAFAIWKTDTDTQRLQFSISNDSLLIDMKELNEGSGELSFEIFSNIKYLNQYPGQWFGKKNIILQQSKALSYKGPDSFNDADWFPRVELKDGIGHAAIVALRPDDPYFMVKNPDHPSLRLTVDRGYWKTVGGVQFAGGNTWTCANDCFNVPNENFFASLPTRIGEKPWNHISIIILFEVNNEGGGWVLNFEYNLLLAS